MSNGKQCKQILRVFHKPPFGSIEIQCKRCTTHPSGYCWQHRPMKIQKGYEFSDGVYGCGQGIDE